MKTVSKGPKRAPVIAILSYNRVKLLRKCIESIFANTSADYRICVVDQASTDGTRNYLKKLGDRIDHMATDENHGFVDGNNLVMEEYAESDVVLLNNDTEVQPGWLTALVDRAYSDPTIGVVGAKLIYPDGLLQAAGCEIFSDASGREIGKYDDPSRFIYNQTADVDYCSGACLYVKRETLNQTGFFDTQYAPAYWEDTDLCFAARDAGYRVVYEPQSVVVHHEGGSFGSAHAQSRSSELQDRNRPKFIKKWSSALAAQRDSIYRIPGQEGKEKILVILPFLPLYDRAAGEMRWFHTLKLLTKRYQVVFLARNGQDGIKYINPLEKMGITVFHTDQERLRQLGTEMTGPVWIDFPALLQANDFKAVIVGFYHVAAQYYKDIRQFSPEAKLIVDSFDVAFLRERRRAEITGKDEDLWHAEEVRRIELGWYEKFDMVLTVTEEDRDILLKENRSLAIGISTDIHPVPEGEWTPGRHDLVYIGNFKHQPNEDAVLYFAEEVLPKIHEEIPDARFLIVGNAPTKKIKALAGDRVVVTGFVPDIVPYLRRAAVCVVPLRYGAGLKGKVGQAMAAGCPQVMTSIGAEGMGIVHERDALIANGANEFARETIRLYQDPAMQEKIARNARQLVADRYSYEKAAEYWEEVFEFIENKTPPEISRLEEKKISGTGYLRLAESRSIVPRVSIIIPVLDNLSLTTSCWTSIRKNTRIPYELLIIDNGSTEPIALDATLNNYRCIRNDTNLGFAAAINQGIRNSQGEYVVLLNNDTVVTPGWLESMIKHIDRDSTIGIVAPLTNYANTEQRIPVDYHDEKELYRFSSKLAKRNRGQSRQLRKVIGMCMVIPRRVIEEIGLFDERFGIGNFEDDDFCLRARLAGYKVVCAQDSYIHHEGGKTFERIDLDYAALLKTNSEIYMKKWAPVLSRSSNQEEPEVAPLTTILYQDNGSLVPEEIQSTLEDLPAGTDLRILCTDESKFSVFQDSKIPIDNVPAGDFYGRLDEIIRSCRSPFIMLLSTSIKGEKGWFDQMLELAEARQSFGMILPKTDDFEGHCLLIKRSDYLTAGGFSTLFHSAAGWADLAGRMEAGGSPTSIARGAKVAYTGGPDGFSRIDGRERKAVTRLHEAAGHFASGDNASAESCIRESLAFKPDYTSALHLRAALHIAASEPGLAESDLAEILRIEPNDCRALNALGCLAFNQGSTGEAEKRFLEALVHEPKNSDVLRNLADIYFGRGAIVQAMTLYGRLVEQDPDNTETYLALGAWFEELGEWEGAADWYRQALRVDETCDGASERLAAITAAGAGSNTGSSHVH